MALPPVKDDKFPPDRGDEPIDADEQFEEREKKGRVKKKKRKDKDGGRQSPDA